MAVGWTRLADHLAALDAARFSGRSGILSRVDRVLAGETARRVVLVHGPGGIGKSALLREIGRRAAAAERPVRAVDARVLDPVPGALEKALEGADELAGVVVSIDSFEHVGAMDSLLRERILPGLPADAVVVVAGRRAPSPGWFRDGWEHVVVEVPLGPLSSGEARELLAALEVTDPAAVEPLVAWARGSPLALSLAVYGSDEDQADLAEMDLNGMIVRRLAGDELGDVDSEVLEVAAVARAVDARLLAAVLPGRATRAANETLRRCSVAEPVGARVTLHDLVRSALHDDLRRRDPGREAELRCRLADHLFARATAGESRLLWDLMELIHDPDVRWGFGGDANARVRIDPWRLDEVDVLVDAYLAHMGHPRYWEDLAPLLVSAPEMGLVARDLDGAPLAFTVATSAARAPAAAAQDPLLGPLLDDAHRRGSARSMIFRETFRMPGPAGDAAFGALNLSAVLRSGLPNVERSYVLDTLPNPDSDAFFQAVGAVREPSLDGVVADRLVACWILDHGADGMLGNVRDVIYAECGAMAPEAGQRREEDLLIAAVEAVRQYGRPDALANNPLLIVPGATGPDGVPGPDGVTRPAAAATDEQRVKWLQAAVRAAVDAAFGPGETERLQRQVVELADLQPAVSHDQAISRLSVSRATYFRHLRQARQRVAATLVENLRH